MVGALKQVIKSLGLWNVAEHTARGMWNVYNYFKYSEVTLTVVIWPPAKHLIKEILAEVEKHYPVSNLRFFSVDAERMEKFVVDLYKIDRASEVKISSKIERLMRPPHDFFLFDITIDDPKVKAHCPYNSWVRTENVSDLKKVIRDEFSPKIEDYVHDIIIHSTEIDSQNDLIRQVIEKHQGKIAERDRNFL